MKQINNTFFITFLLSIVLSCATIPSVLHEKYKLDNELEPVEQINELRISGWDQVDNQSVILNANMDEYYLLILFRPLENMAPNLTIGISSSVSSIRAGYDRIYVKGLSTGVQDYLIKKIYRLNGAKQVEEIKDRLLKK